MTVEDFVNVLVAEMEADESTSLVDQILRDARAKVKACKGAIGSITASGLNGKSFSRTVEFTPLQVIDACRRALTLYASGGEDDGTVPSTRADFSAIDR